MPRECALKVFKTTLSEFKNRCQYVCGDVRFFKDEFKKQNPRKIMKIWAQKEELNLKRYVLCLNRDYLKSKFTIIIVWRVVYVVDLF